MKSIKNKKVKKPNIIVLSEGRITALQHKAYTAMLFIARQALERLLGNKDQKRATIARENTVFETDLDTLLRIGAIQDKNRGERFRESLVALTSVCCVYVNVYVWENEDARTGAFAYLSSYEQTGNSVTFQLPFQVTTRLLCNGYHYTLVDLWYLSRLKSIHARILYETLSRVKAFGRLAMPLDQFKRIMGAEGCEAYEANFSVLRRRVITPAIKEINDNTDVRITTCGEKTQRGSKKVVSLVFTFEITRSLGMTEQDGSLLEKGRRQKKHVAAMMKRFRELCVEDPDFEYSTEREMRARMERNPHFASLSLSQRIATMVEEMEFHNMIEVHEEADNDALSEHLA